MVFPRRILPLCVLALALTPSGVVAATKSAKRSTKGYVVPCFKADGLTLEFVRKPERCVAADESTVERGLVPVTNIKWTTWTTRRASATGSVKGPGYQGKVVVTATKPKRCSARRVIFTRLDVSIKLDGELGRIGWVDAACPA